MKPVGMVTHEDDPKVPEGMACLCQNDSGWIGTNNGHPFAGQPALFPEDQALKIMQACNAHSLSKDLYKIIEEQRAEIAANREK